MVGASNELVPVAWPLTIDYGTSEAPTLCSPQPGAAPGWLLCHPQQGEKLDLQRKFQPPILLNTRVV